LRLSGPHTEEIRALHVIPGQPEGSVMIFARREAGSLRLAGIRVESFYLTSRTSLRTLVQEWRRFRRHVAEFRPHIVHAHFGTLTGLFCVAASPVPVILTFRGTDLNPDPMLPRWRTDLGRFFSRISAIRARRVVCVTEQLKRRLWWGRQKTCVMPGSVNFDLFQPMEREEACELLGWEPQTKRVLFNFGRFPVIKRPDLAARAVDVARTIVGNIDLIQLDGNTPPETMPAVYNAVDCILVTSDWEGSPTIVREAMACNLPIVSVDVGDVAEMTQGAAPGTIAERDPAKLGQAVADILKSRARSNGRSLISHLNEEVVAGEVRRLYESALGREKAQAHRGMRSTSAEHLLP